MLQRREGRKKKDGEDEGRWDKMEKRSEKKVLCIRDGKGSCLSLPIKIFLVP